MSSTTRKISFQKPLQKLLEKWVLEDYPLAGGLIQAIGGDPIGGAGTAGGGFVGAALAGASSRNSNIFGPVGTVAGGLIGGALGGGI